ncbi:MAG: hydroxymethylglutaryl-CoA reductase [Verrucomicrobiota bacterium]|jgi:hydroxymethylglutaryl-CoA reductase (NADPH)|nr:hydroxymethylglutaryl-CoA reductase [Verrucomicrobiota bacterium]|tara:strand:+ start:227 stop:1450 length:1224 start_codon:yes stop_codon:yes gene_type:complete
MNASETTVKQEPETAMPSAGGNGQASGKVTPPRGYAVDDMQRRVEWLEGQTGHRLDEFALEDPPNFKGLTENQIGYIGMPLSIAGPLRIDGSYAKGDFYVPLCTLEGTLSLSMTRGFYLTYLSGGITSRHIKQQLSRSPVFIFETLEEAYDFLPWVDEHYEEIKASAESTTRHGKLLRMEKHPIHNRVLMEFNYDTAEAAGQNMVTMATDAACRWIMEHYQATQPFRYLVESNFCCDKNPAHKTIMHGRGHHVICSFTVSDRLLRKLLRVSVDDIVRCITDKHLGSQMAGVVGLNLHTSNAIAALYLALGQDVACVAENCVGIATYEKHGDDLYATLSMPSVTVGTVGGATRLSQQRRNLELLNCTGDKSSRKLAEIICASALALEISLAGAIVSNEFALAHAKFGR